MRVLAIIPARSGSKGIPNKNIKKLNGKTLIRISCETAINSGCFDDVILASDCEAYFEEFHEDKSIETYLRSKKNSSDSSSIFDLLKEMELITESYDVIVLLQPTSPLRTSMHIKEAVELYKQSKGSVVSAKRVSYKPELLLYEDSGRVRKLIQSNSSNRQFYRSYYELNGAIYIFNKEYIDRKSFIDESTTIYLMDELVSVDIDTPEDLEKARIRIEGEK